MAIKANFNKDMIRQRFDAFLSAIERAQIEQLMYLGEMCVIHAKGLSPDVGFYDRTGNLRSSIGYTIFRNGVAMHDNYTGSGEGTTSGRELSNQVGAKYKKGIALVITAGMSYAVYVESRGKDVLTSAEQLAKQEMPKILRDLQNNINKAIQ